MLCRRRGDPAPHGGLSASVRAHRAAVLAPVGAAKEDSAAVVEEYPLVAAERSPERPRVRGQAVAASLEAGQGRVTEAVFEMNDAAVGHPVAIDVG